MCTVGSGVAAASSRNAFLNREDQPGYVGDGARHMPNERYAIHRTREELQQTLAAARRALGLPAQARQQSAQGRGGVPWHGSTASSRARLGRYESPTKERGAAAQTAAYGAEQAGIAGACAHAVEETVETVATSVAAALMTVEVVTFRTAARAPTQKINQPKRNKR